MLGDTDERPPARCLRGRQRADLADWLVPGVSRSDTNGSHGFTEDGRVGYK